MTRCLPLIVVAFVVLTSTPTFARGDDPSSKIEAPASASARAPDGFEPVDPATLDTVSGKRLMIAAYSVILGALALYSLVLLLRSRRVSRQIDRLESQLGTSPTRPTGTPKRR